jgi:hypothetical protein
MLSTQWPLPPLWECYGIETYEMWERRKGLCTVANFLGWSSCLFEGFPKWTHCAERCEIKVLYWALCILLTIVQRLYTH